MKMFGTECDKVVAISQSSEFSKTFLIYTGHLEFLITAA